MFDKLKDAVSDLIGKNDDAEKAVDTTTSAADDVKSTLGQTIDDVKEGGLSADSLKSAAGDLGGLKDRLTGDANSLSGVVDQIGGLGELTQFVQGIDFPINKDELISQLKQNGSFNDIVEKLEGVANEQFGSKSDLLDTVKGFISK